MKRKAGALLLALCMMLGCTATVFAEGNTTIEFDEQEIMLGVGETVRLNVTVTPAVQPEQIQWDSDTTAVATVDAQGNVTGVAAGEAYVTATVDGVSESVFVIVKVPTSYKADRFDGLDQAEILANLNKIAGPFEVDHLDIETGKLPNAQSMKLDKAILNKIMALEFSLNAKLNNSDGTLSYMWTFNVDLSGTTPVTEDVDLAVDIYKAADSDLARLFPKGKALVLDVKQNGTLPEDTELYFDHGNYFDNEDAYLYKVAGDGTVTKVREQAYAMQRDVNASLRMSQGGTYVLATDQNAQYAFEFEGKDLVDNKQAVLDSLAKSSQPTIYLGFEAAEQSAVVPADVIEAALANGKQLAVVLENGDGVPYMWLFNAYGETKTVTASDVKLFVQRQDVSQDGAIQALVKGQGKTMRLDFAHEGALPPGTALALSVDSLFTEGETLYLYQLENGELFGAEGTGKPAEAKVEKGLVVYDVEHCSSYILTNVAPQTTDPQSAQPTQTEAPETTASPQTGDASDTRLWIILTGLSLAGIVLTAVRRKATR